MSLEEKIKEQYAHRSVKDSLYNSEYSRQADIERIKKTKDILTQFSFSPDSILEIGAGQGDNVPMFLDLGYSEKAIFLNELLTERILTLRTNYPKLTLYEGDALILNFGRSFDCIYQSTVFTSILNDEDKQLLAKKMWNLLNPGGIILWYDFIYNNPKNPHVKGVGIAETKSLFPQTKKSCMYKITLAPPIGRRVGKMYPLFNLPFLRSHILAVFQK